MILIINICKEQLHYYEFVKPIEDIITKSNQTFITRHYIDDYSTIIDDLVKCDRVIITGTSLKDMGYSSSLSKFDFLKSYTKPVLAICGGMQLLCMIYKCKLIKGREIGLNAVNFESDYLGVNGSREAYTLHNMAIRENTALKKSFNIFSRTKYVQSIKHKVLPHYGLLFHPEVRNKDLIVNFLYV